MEKLTKLMADVLRLQEDEITDDLSIKDSENWDSLKHMELVASIEQVFGVSLTFDDIISMVNVKAIKNVLKSKREDL